MLCPTGWCQRYYGASGALLNYEVEVWNTNGTSYVWVQVPVLTNGASITARWGDPANVSQLQCTTNGATWADYKFVSHNGGKTDSGPNQYAVTTVGTLQTTTGAIGTATAFWGSATVSNLYSIASMTGGLGDAAFTISTYFMPTNIAADTPRQAPLYCEYDLIGNAKNYLSFGQVTTHATKNQLLFDQYLPAGNTVTSLPVVVNNKWTYGAAVQLTANTRFSACFANISVTGSETYAGGTPVTYAIGQRQTAAYNSWWFLGLIDEIRLTQIARSPNWLWAEYMNMASNQVFQSYGAVTQ
jgi:hypothetical protein